MSGVCILMYYHTSLWPEIPVLSSGNGAASVLERGKIEYILLAYFSLYLLLRDTANDDDVVTFRCSVSAKLPC